MPTATRNRNPKHEPFERILKSERDQLRKRISGRLGEVYVDREPDDDAALASDNVTKELTVATLERERRALEEIETALERMKTGRYGLCAFCGSPIPDGRLQALPSAQLCLTCALRASHRHLAAD